MAKTDPIDESDIFSPTAHVGNIEAQEIMINVYADQEEEFVPREAATVPTQQSFDKYATRTRTGKSSSLLGLNAADVGKLVSKYNKHIYTSPGADVGSTFFKIGPLTYGGEVQDIKILETKAIQSVAGARAGKDYLVDGGEGSADISVSMIFSGKQHILDGLIPLIALFKISPITSVDNSVIKTALYDKFTENDTPGPDAIVLDTADKVLNLSLKLRTQNNLLQAIGEDGYTVSKEQFERAKAKNYGPIQSISYEDWISSLDNLKEFVADPVDNLFVNPASIDIGRELDKSRQSLGGRLDKTGHVPVAFIGIDVSTHPDLPEALLVTLTLKRINVQNFLRDYLQYRSIVNIPTPDARKAFWLNRAVDLYIDKYYPDGLFNIEFGTVKLSYAGDDLVLKFFKDSENLKTLYLNDERTKQYGTAVVQLSFGIRNKFAFHRLAGDAYPTAQHMGVSSGALSIGIRTDNSAKFEQIHTFKSAADFFSRATDRLDRFNGWKIDCLLTRLFNTKENPLGKTATTIAGAKIFYPDSVMTATASQYPKLRDISMSFVETSPDFFSDFGFSLLTNGMTVETIQRFYTLIITNLDPNRFAYNNFIYYGSGTEDEHFSLLNPDTIVAAFLEKQRVGRPNLTKDAVGFIFDDDDPTSSEIIRSLKSDPKYSGELATQNRGIDLLVEEIGTAFGFPFEVALKPELAEAVLKTNFNVTNELVRNQLIKLIQKIGYQDGRRELYVFLFANLNAGTIKTTDRFDDHLFAAIVKRAVAPFSDRLYNRINVANAYDTLERAIASRPEDIDFDHNGFSAVTPGLAIADLNKSRAVDNAMVFNTDGSLEISQRRITSYPDYLYITFQDLFDLPEVGFGPGNWQEYAYTYQDLGIINPDIKSYSDDQGASLGEYSVNGAQKEPVTRATSPVPPSIFFYRERELEEIRVNIDTQYKEWLDSLFTLKLELPYDIEFLLTEAGRLNGGRGIFDSKGNIIDVANISSSDYAGLATILERMNEHNRSSSIFGETGLVKAASQAVTAQFHKLKEDLSYSGSDLEFKRYIDTLRKEDKNNPAVLKYDRLIIDGEDFQAFVPVMYAVHSRDVARYRKMSGTVGSSRYKTIVNMAAKISGKSPEDMIGDIVTKSAANLDDGIGITGTSYEELHNAALKATQSICDNRNDIIKAFPVFRLYLIDYNKGDRIFVRDNFYGYNAIESIDITLDKNDADLAVIRIADPMHILQGSIFDDKLTWNKGVVRGFTLPNSTSSDDTENFLARFELKQGRAIQVRGGYSADPDNLDILFTGRIAEVTFGDIVTVIAQGWKAELLGKQVDFELTSVDNSSVKDLVTRTIRDANPAGMGVTHTQEELNQLVELSKKFSLDGAVIRSIQNQYGTFGGDSGYSGTEGFLGLHILGNRFQGLDMRLKNIWVPDNNKTRFNPFADIESTGWEGDQWIVTMQPAWDVLQQATNYAWGYICQTVPYDGEATLFFGRPEQLYYFTKGNPRELTGYRTKYLAEQKKFKQTVDDLFNDFLKTNYYTGGQLYEFLKNLSGKRLFINDVSSDALTYSVKLSDFNSPQPFTFEPNQFSLAGYALYTNVYKDNVARDVPNSKFGNYSAGALTNNNLRHDFYKESFVDVAPLVGGDNNLSMFLFCSFFGLSESYINKNFYPVSVTVRELLSPLTEERIKAIKGFLRDSASSNKEEEVASDLLDLNFVSKEIATNALNVLGKFDTAFMNQFGTAIREAAGFDRNVGTISLARIVYTGDYSDHSKEDVEDFLKVLESFFDSRGKIDEALYPDVQRSSQIGIGSLLRASTDFLFTAALNIELSHSNNSVVQFFNSPGAVIRIVNKAKSFYNASIDSDEDVKTTVGQMFDPEYSSMASRLNVALPFETESQGTLSEYFSSNRSNIDEFIINNITQFRAYCFFFCKFINDTNNGSGTSLSKDHLNSIKGTNHFRFPPALNMKPFRDYHYISSGVEIIVNNIGASTREMSNTVVIRGISKITTSNDEWYKFRWAQGDYDSVEVQDIEWQTWPHEDEQGHIGYQFNDSLTLENKKIAVYTDINVTRRDQAAKVATNVMAKSLRPMYRNNLLVMGRAIKPWDHIHLDDKYSDMLGPIEVERVTHHYNVSQGWVTNIIPHAVVEANPGNAAVQRAVIANMFDKIYNTVDTALWGITILTAIPTLGASVGLVKASGQFLASRTLQASIFKGVGFLEKKGVQEVATKWAATALPSDKFRILKNVIVRDAPSSVRSYFYANTASFAVGEITRGFYMNSMAGNLQSPVTISPLLFKGVPFEAGLNGRETSYFSLTSKLHWTYQDLKEGLRQAGSFITDFVKRPNPSVAETNLRAMNRTQNK